MVEPFLKWPGGKRWLATRYSALFPNSFGRYIEPFVGGAAVFFALEPRKAYLSDSNAELINVYLQIKRDWRSIEELLSRYQAEHSSVHYYKVRKETPIDVSARAARFIYLNRTCFNGIYRVNRKGAFNVPMGTKDAVSFQDGYLKAVSQRLQCAAIFCRDFEVSIDCANAGDFVFVDPPYTVMHNDNGFVKYNAQLFSWEDQTRLSLAVRRAAGRGALVMMSNANHDSVKKLYDGFGRHHVLSRASVLAGDASCRRVSTELLVTSY